MKVENLEIVLVFIIVVVQLYVFVRTLNLIKTFKNIIPNTSSLKVTKVYVPVDDLNQLSPTDILTNISNYRDRHSSPHDLSSTNLRNQDFSYSEHNEPTNPPIELNIIETSVKSNKIFDKIIVSTNNYLIRNHGTASDFNLLKDIVERNTDAIEEDIRSSIGVPLYLGLMGTMLGIVIGLFNMPEMGSIIGNTKAMDIKLNEGIGLLIGGVKIAMIASFIGLLFTIINSGWVFKGSKNESESKKNEFYTFLQIELLPLINQGLSSTLESLQRNLHKFNEEFSSNLIGLSGIFDSSRKAIREQKELLDALDKAKVSDMTRYNVSVLKQLDVSVRQFEKFNDYFSHVTQFVENSKTFVDRTNELLDRTNNFKSIAESLEDKLNQSQQLMQFLSSHFNKLDEHKILTNNAVADVGHSISDIFNELKVHIQNSTQTVKKFTIEEMELLRSVFSSNKTNFNNLNNLEHLQTLKTDVASFKNNSASQVEKLKQTIDELNTNMAKSIALLEKIEKQSISVRAKDMGRSIMKLFKSK